MKVLTASTVLVLASMITSVGHASAIDGNWKFVGLTCLSGSAPSTSPGNGSIDSVQIADTSVTISGSYGDCKVIVGPMSVAISADKITPTVPKSQSTITCPGGFSQTDTIDMAGELAYVRSGDTLTVSMKNTQNGACVAGDTEVTTLQLVP